MDTRQDMTFFSFREPWKSRTHGSRTKQEQINFCFVHMYGSRAEQNTKTAPIYPGPSLRPLLLLDLPNPTWAPAHLLGPQRHCCSHCSATVDCATADVGFLSDFTREPRLASNGLLSKCRDRHPEICQRSTDSIPKSTSLSVNCSLMDCLRGRPGLAWT